MLMKGINYCGEIRTILALELVICNLSVTCNISPLFGWVIMLWKSVCIEGFVLLAKVVLCCILVLLRHGVCFVKQGQ